MALSSYLQSINMKPKVTHSEYIVNALPEKFSSQALQIISSDGVYLEISSTEHRMRSRFIKVDFRSALGCSLRKILVNNLCDPGTQASSRFLCQVRHFVVQSGSRTWPD